MTSSRPEMCASSSSSGTSPKRVDETIVGVEAIGVAFPDILGDAHAGDEFA